MNGEPSSSSRDQGPDNGTAPPLRQTTGTWVSGAVRHVKERGRSLRTAVERLVSRPRYAGAVFGEGLGRLKQELRGTRFGGSAPVRLVTRVAQELGEDDASHMAASVSYYTVLSLFPLILGLSATIGLIAESPSRQEQVVDFIVDFLPGSEQFVRDTVSGVVKIRGVLGIGAVFGLLWAASAVFGSIARAVNRAWDVHQDRPFYKKKPRQLGMALGVGVLFAISVAVTSFFQYATTIEIGDRTVTDLLGGGIVAGILKIPAFFITFAIFLAIYKYIPNTKTYWRYIWLGAMIAAVLFEVGKNLFLWYLETFAQYDQLYGNVASIIVLMVWTYFSAFILILGAEFASEYGRMKLGIKRGQRIHT